MQIEYQTMLRNLITKTAAMHNFKQQCASIATFARLAHSSTTPANISLMLRAEIQNLRRKAYRQVHSDAKLNMIPVDQQISALRDVSLADKRELLNAVPIIPVAVGAAFLGVSEAHLHAIHSHRSGVFGDIYLRRRCNSLKELLLIAQHPEWLPDGFYSSELVLGNSSVLDSLTYVDICTAAAYTDMKLEEVDNRIKSNGRFSYQYGPTYRVSDLEEIRVAKLKAQQV